MAIYILNVINWNDWWICLSKACVLIIWDVLRKSNLLILSQLQTKSALQRIEHCLKHFVHREMNIFKDWYLSIMWDIYQKCTLTHRAWVVVVVASVSQTYHVFSKRKYPIEVLIIVKCERITKLLFLVDASLSFSTKIGIVLPCSSLKAFFVLSHSASMRGIAAGVVGWKILAHSRDDKWQKAGHLNIALFANESHLLCLRWQNRYMSAPQVWVCPPPWKQKLHFKTD